MFRTRLSSLVAAASVVVIVACSDATSPTAPTADAASPRLQGGSGGGGGGGGTTFDPYTILPTTAPAPGILVRESFGLGPNRMRPASGKGELRTTEFGAGLNGFWLEYPGSRNTQWIASETGQRWVFTGSGSGRDTSELASPLQVDEMSYGNAWSDFLFEYQGQAPTALLPIAVTLPNGGYELSATGFPGWIVPGAYLAIGFTDSNLLYSNLTSSGSLWLKITDPSTWGYPLHYELWQGSEATGRLIASGDGGSRDFTYGRYAIRYSPSTKTVTLSVGGSLVGTFPATMGTPKYIAIEGVGALDNLVLRQ